VFTSGVNVRTLSGKLPHIIHELLQSWSHRFCAFERMFCIQMSEAAFQYRRDGPSAANSKQQISRGLSDSSDSTRFHSHWKANSVEEILFEVTSQTVPIIYLELHV